MRQQGFDKRFRIAATAAGILAVVVLFVVVRIFFRVDQDDALKNADAGLAEEGAIKPDESVSVLDTVSFTAVGDNLIHASIYQQAAERADYDGYDFSYCYEAISPFVKKHDINWINMETLITEDIGPYSFPRFATPGDDARDLYRAGWNVFSLASNHTMDHGDDGIWSTLDFWRNEMPDDIIFTGIWDDDEDVGIMTIRGHRFAFVSYTFATNYSDEGYYGSVIDLYNPERVADQMAYVREIADVVVVGAHWGEEYDYTITDMEQEWAQMLADEGADIIIGTHPHVVQDYTWITAADGRKVFCIYSIGNFISLQESTDNVVGLMLEGDFIFKENAVGKQWTDFGNIHLIPVVSVYGEDWADAHVVFLSDLTQKDIAQHGVKETDPSFSYDRIIQVLKAHVGEELLVLPE